MSAVQTAACRPLKGSNVHPGQHIGSFERRPTARRAPRSGFAAARRSPRSMESLLLRSPFAKLPAEWAGTVSPLTSNMAATATAPPRPAPQCIVDWCGSSCLLSSPWSGPSKFAGQNQLAEGWRCGGSARAEARRSVVISVTIVWLLWLSNNNEPIVSRNTKEHGHPTQ